MTLGAARMLRTLAGLALLTGPCLRAQGIEPYHAKEIQPYHAKGVTPDQAQPPAPSGQPVQAEDPASFFRTFGLAVPGVAYSWDDLAAGTRHHVASAGARTGSWIRVNPDHTYVWVSDWVGKTLHGRWILHKDGLLLQHGEEGKDWILGRLPRPRGAALVYLFDGNWMTYHGTPKPRGR
ncbi:MAG TPA: hypothetical protein VF768_02500 [Holophagaceae bacterium]